MHIVQGTVKKGDEQGGRDKGEQELEVRRSRVLGCQGRSSLGVVGKACRHSRCRSKSRMYTVQYTEQVKKGDVQSGRDMQECAGAAGAAGAGCLDAK